MMQYGLFNGPDDTDQTKIIGMNNRSQAFTLVLPKIYSRSFRLRITKFGIICGLLISLIIK